jgi:hypothetical protein
MFLIYKQKTVILLISHQSQQPQCVLEIGTSIPDKTYINNFVVEMEITKKDGEKEHTDWLVSHCLKGGLCN